MGTRKHKPRDKKGSGRKAAQRSKVVTLVELCYSATRSKDVDELRRLAAEHGLVSKELRSKCWPLLLGVEQQHSTSDECYAAWSVAGHRDSTTVRCDVDRSLHTFLKGATPQRLAARRVELHRLLTAAINHTDGVYYYQGLHDIASVLLLTLGEAAAFPVLCQLVTCHLRDNTRNSMDAVLELFQLLQPLLEAADRDLANHAAALGLAPYFALPWVLTWFSHDTTSLSEAARLFDLFIASHPLMPMYVGVAAMHCWRDQLLACPGMAELHSALMNAWRTWPLDVEHVIEQAMELFKKLDPERLRRGQQLTMAVSQAAYLADGRWVVPDRPPPVEVVPARGAISGSGLFKLVQRAASGKGGAVIVSAVLSVGGVSLLALIAQTYLTQMASRIGY